MNKIIAVFTVLLAMSSAALGAQCIPTPSVAQLVGQGWGLNEGSHRFAGSVRIDKANVAELTLNWVFALDDGMSPHSYPVVSEDTVFVGTDVGTLYALDRTSGCTRWRYDADESIRTGLVHGTVSTSSGEQRTALFFGSAQGSIHAVDAVTGERLWSRWVGQHPRTMLTGTPTYHKGDLYVPLSSSELGLAISPFYGCCKSRGGLLRLNASTGEDIWRSETIAQPAQVTGRHWLFVEQWGPSGAPIWSAPTVDEALGLVFVGTGENYTAPATTTSDAILAFSMEDGALRWSRQFTADDTFNMSCVFSFKHPNCPDNAGPDLDFGAPPILVRLPGRAPLLLAGQKSGGVYGMNAADGQLLWQQHLGRGGYLGGVHWGMAVDLRKGLLFVPLNDIDVGPPQGRPEPGVHALDMFSGEVRWAATKADACGERSECRSGFSAAIVATAELVFATALDGMIYAIDSSSGEFLWEYDSWREFDSVNGLPTRGGAIDTHGPLVAGKQLFVQSGYGSFGQRGGNALLVFELPEGTGEN